MKKFLAVIMVVLGLGITACDAKVTDPADPRFDPEQFRFENYKDHQALVPVLRHMFPIGTDRAYVDHILGEKAGAQISQGDFEERKKITSDSPGYGFGGQAWQEIRRIKAETFSTYAGPGGFKFQFMVFAFYDHKGKLTQMIAHHYVIHPTIPNAKTGE